MDVVSRRVVGKGSGFRVGCRPGDGLLIIPITVSFYVELASTVVNRNGQNQEEVLELFVVRRNIRSVEVSDRLT